VSEDKDMGYSVRLIKDSTTLTHGQTGTYVGNDNRIYQTVCIGTQEWLSENLMETKYRNGDAIPEVRDNTAWAALTTGARCSYNNTITNTGTGSRLTSSDDWVVLTKTQYDTLIIYLGGSTVAGGHMKETGLVYWNSQSAGCDNSSQLNVRGSGIRQGTNGIFQSINESTLLMTATDAGSYLYAVNIVRNLDSALSNDLRFKTDGLPIRLIYTGAGTPTSYTGNDGKIYRVVTINGVAYLADNLAETKYRDGSYISGYDGGVYTPIANATWAALTTGALCAYSDDTNNI